MHVSYPCEKILILNYLFFAPSLLSEYFTAGTTFTVGLLVARFLQDPQAEVKFLLPFLVFFIFFVCAICLKLIPEAPENDSV